MKNENSKLPRSFFTDKWYIREDLCVEPFNNERHIENCNYMKNIGNCFDTKFEALEKCNSIRILFGLSTIK